MPRNASRQGYDETYIASDEYRESIQRGLRDLLADALSEDRFDKSALDALRALGHIQFGDQADIPSVLWQNGLLGFSNGSGRPHFYSLQNMDESSRSSSRRSVPPVCSGQHPSIRAKGSIPVQPF